MAFLVCENLEYLYSMGTPFQTAALDDVSLEIEKGELVGIIGHTGSGKSTLIQHLNGLLEPHKGNVILDGENIWTKENRKKIRQVRFAVGLCFQYPEYQIFEEDVYKEIAFGPKQMGLDEAEIDKRIRKSMEFVGLSFDEFSKKSPFDLSGGQKRRVAIAGVLAMRPEVLILDEPTAGLDPKGRDEILDLLAAMHKERKITIILVSHSMEDVAKYVSRIIVMNQGQVMFDDVPKEVFRHYKELEAIGLAAPQVTYLMHELKEEGFPVSTDATTVDEARDEILRVITKRQDGTVC